MKPKSVVGALLVGLWALSAVGQIPLVRMLDMLNASQRQPVDANVFPSFGFTPKAWWVMSDARVIGTAFTVPDRVSGSYPLTNIGASSAFPVRVLADLNGYDTLAFSVGNDSGLYSANYTSAQPHQVTCVISTYDTPLQGNVFAMLYSPPYQELIKNGGSFIFAMYAGTLLGNVACPASNYFVFDAVFSGSSSAFYTNGVLEKAGDAGTSSMNGIALGSGNIKGVNMRVAEMVTFVNDLPSTNTVGRSNLFYYFNHKYNISP